MTHTQGDSVKVFDWETTDGSCRDRNKKKVVWEIGGLFLSFGR